MTNPSITIPSPTTIGASGSDVIDASGSSAVDAGGSGAVGAVPGSVEPAYFAASHEDNPAIPIEKNLSIRTGISAPWQRHGRWTSLPNPAHTASGIISGSGHGSGHI